MCKPMGLHIKMGGSTGRVVLEETYDGEVMSSNPDTIVNWIIDSRL